LKEFLKINDKYLVMRKSIIKLSILLFTVFCIACEDDEPTFQTVQFEADFFTQLVSFEENSGCSTPKNFLNTQSGDGTASLMGEFTTTLTFCVNPANFEYENVQGSFVAENGDEIFVTGAGQVLPSDEEGYDLEFMDPFEIIGGTGQFKDATGSGMTNSFVNMTTGQTDHVWTGTIRVKK
jgi:hypothetical protein